MRLLDKSRRRRRSRSSASPTTMRDAARATIIARPTGALLVTGPTGSGKSTTLYAALDEINRPEINVITVEDPVEYRLAGRQPGADQPARRPDVRDGAALDPPLRPGRRDGRRDPRRRDGQDLDRGRPHRPLRALDAAHERRPGRGHAAERDGRRAVPHRRRRHRPCSPSGSRGSSARTAARCTSRRRRSCSQSRVAPDVAAGVGRDGLLPQGRLPALRPDRATGAAIGIFQFLDDERGARELDVDEGDPRGDRARRDATTGMRSLWDDGMDKVVAGLTSVEELARVVV